MKTLILSLAVAIAAAAAPPARATDVQSFLARTASVETRTFGVLSRDFRVLMLELDVAIRSLREERLAAEAAGQRAAYCPRGRGSLSMDYAVAALRAMPEDARAGVELADALRPALAGKYPCASGDER